MPLKGFAGNAAEKETIVTPGRVLMEIKEISTFYGEDPDDPRPFDVKDENGKVRYTSDPNVKAILINIFGGITRGDVVAEGIREALGKVGVTVPIVGIGLPASSSPSEMTLLSLCDPLTVTSHAKFLRSMICVVRDASKPAFFTWPRFFGTEPTAAPADVAMLTFTIASLVSLL